MVKIIILTLCLIFSSAAQAKNKPNVPPISYALYRVDDGQYLTGTNENTVRPMASITKLMSALVVLKKELDLNEVLTVRGPEGSPRIRQGMQLTRGQLLELALVSSDNLAVRTLAETYPGGYNAFIEEMNHTANDLDMSTTRYTDSTGLSSANTSTVDDIRKLVLAASPFNIVTMASNTTKLVFDGTFNKAKNKTVKVQGVSTNFFAGKLDIIAAKTGFTSHAGSCLTMMINHQGMRYLLVVMGAQSSEHRKKLVQDLLDKIK